MLPYEISDEIRNAVCAVPTSEIRAYAKEAATTVSVRTWRDGNSYDKRRESTPKEAEIVENLIVAGIWAGRYNRDSGGHYMPDNIREAASAAEWGGQAFFTDYPEESQINCYDTIFCPVIQWFRDRGAYRF